MPSGAGGPILPPGGAGAIPSQQTGGTCSYFVLDICAMAMKEIGALDPAETPTGPEVNDVVTKLNRILDARNTEGRYIYAIDFNTYVTTAGVQPHTIGPTGNFVVNQRPVKILDASIILNPGGATAVRSPVRVHDGKQGAEWWSAKRTFAVQGVLITDLYYEPDWNNGSIFFWTVPNNAQTVELETWSVLGQLQANSAFCMPPGYFDDVVYTLAVNICPMFGKEASPTLVALARDANRRVQGLNTAAPFIATADAGTPRRIRPYFNYRTGLSR
jgi:hypothetical protein